MCVDAHSLSVCLSDGCSMACQDPMSDKVLSLLNILIWLVGAALSASFYRQLGPFKVLHIMVYYIYM